MYEIKLQFLIKTISSYTGLYVSTLIYLYM